MKKKIYSSLILLSALLQLKAQDTTKAKEEFKPSGKFSGQVFGDFQYKASSPDSTNLRTYPSKAQYAFANGYDNKYSSFEFRRIYLGYDYNFTEKFSAQFLLSHESNTGLDAAGQRTVYIKAANIRWKNIFKGTDAVFGQQATPTWGTFTEAIYGHRWVEKTISDMRGLASSNDFGLSLQGKYKDGKVGYEAMMGNDNGGKPENDNFKRFYGNLWAKFLNKRLILDLYSDYELTQLSPNGPGLEHSTKSKMLTKAFIAWQQEKFLIGAEVIAGEWKNYSFHQDTAKVPDPSKKDTVSVKPFGISFFAKANLLSKKVNDKNVPLLGVFVRYDSYNPDKNFNSALKYTSTSYHVSETFFIVGIDYSPIPQFHIMPNIWINSYKENAPLTTSANPAGKGVQASGSDMDYRVTMFWKF
ncbi:MAG: hypothetical protein HY063_15035 [Bacteroidetes bacterium]|nr:hypothetical protein [Bacteroidota bacterium]